MFIGSDDKLIKVCPEPHVYLDNKPVKRVSAAKTLGIVIDKRMSWSAHTDYICTKISSGLSGLRQVRDYIPTETLITIYNSLIQPWFDYCDVVWDNLPITLANRLQKLQNHAARIITKSSYEIRSKEILTSLGWKPLEKLRKKHKATTMFKIVLAQEPLKALFSLQDDSYNLRQREKCLKLPKPNTCYLKRAPSYNGAQVWHELPQNIRLSNNLKTFRKNLSSI